MWYKCLNHEKEEMECIEKQGSFLEHIAIDQIGKMG